MNIKRTFEEFINEQREDVGKYNTVKKVIAKLGRRPSEQDLATFINNNYYDVTEVERGDDDPSANDKIADLVAFYKFDIDDWEIAWADAQNESVVTEDKTISFAKASMMGSKLLNKISIGTIIDTKGGQYEITGFGQQANAFKEFEATIDGKEVKVKLTAMYGLKLEVTDDVRSARFNKEEEINSIILESVVTETIHWADDKKYQKYEKIPVTHKNFDFWKKKIKSFYKEKSVKQMADEFRIHPRSINVIIYDYLAMEPGFKLKSVVTEGKTSAVYTDPKTGKGYDLQYVSSEKRWELDVMKKGASIYSNAITTIKRNTLAEIQEWLDGYKIDSSWTKGLSESLVTEASKDRMIKQIERALKDGTSIFKLPMDTQKYYHKNKSDFESLVTEAKTLDRDEMMDWLDQTLTFTRTSEEFDGSKGGIWTTGENGEQYKGKIIYDYYSQDYKNRTFGVLNSWEKELNKRGWYSEWYDAGTVMIWQD
jgi:hypothetical protein